MLSETFTNNTINTASTTTQGKSSETSPKRSKVNTEESRFLIRIPRSATTSPGISNLANSLYIPTSSTQVSVDGQSSMSTSHWPQPDSLIQTNAIGDKKSHKLDIFVPEISYNGQEVYKSDSGSSAGAKGKFSQQSDVDQGSPQEHPKKESAAAIEYKARPLSGEQDKPLKEATKFIGCFEYEPFRVFAAGRSKPGVQFDVRISRRYLDKMNPAAAKRSFWGGLEGIYTDDSDIVCILLHMNLDIPQKVTHIKVGIKVLPKEIQYPSVEHSGFKSRCWKNHSGHSIKVLDVRPSGEAPRKKKKSMRLSSLIDESCPLRFSNQTKSPMLNYSELLLQSPQQLQDVLKRHSIAFVGQEHTYTLTAHGKKYCFSRDGRELFNELEWKEIGWTNGGVSIRNTFVNLQGYHL